MINAIASTEKNKYINILLEYKPGTEFDVDNNGVETIGNVVDLTVENSEFDWAADLSRICTRWNVNSNGKETAICYGGDECCSFIGLTSTSSNWNDVFYINYGRYDANYTNVVSAKIVYVNYSIDSQNSYEEIIYSNTSSLNAVFEKKLNQIPTKIDKVKIIPSAVASGDVADVNAKLIDYNNSPIPKQKLDIYLDGNLINTQTTDKLGYILFELDTTPLSVGEHSVDIKFAGTEISSEEEITTYLPASTDSQTLLIEGNQSSIQNTNISFEQIDDCKTIFWDEEEPVYEICKEEYNQRICNDPPINQSCHDEIRDYNYTCIKTQIVHHNREDCKPKELKITKSNEIGRINFGDWGKCTTQEDKDALTVICDSRYDGNGNGVCESGESCIKFEITKEGVRQYLKNSQDEFTEEDESFFLEKLNYEVMSK